MIMNTKSAVMYCAFGMILSLVISTLKNNMVKNSIVS